MIRANIDRRLGTMRLGHAAPDGKGGGTKPLQAGVIPHALGGERDRSVWDNARATRPLGGGPARPPRTEPLQLGRILKLW